MAGFVGPEWEAGRAVNAGDPFLNVNPDLIPVDAELETDYRYLVSVGYRIGQGNTIRYITVEVQSESPLFPEGIRDLGLQNFFNVYNATDVGSSRNATITPLPGETTIIWAARRA